MDAQKYILSQLEALKEPLYLDVEPTNDDEMTDAILKKLLSKKFRKFSIPKKNQKIIQSAVENNISNKEPIKISWPFGGYKLWRLNEAPEPDWAELFTIMYLIRWLKPVCALYPHGVILTFWVDEVVIGQMNNIPQEDLDRYQSIFSKLLSFVEPYQPSNMKFDVFLERSQYESKEVFQKGLEVEMEKLAKEREGMPEPLSDGAIRAIEMNVKLTSEQEKDPLWREKIDLMHNAYYILQEKQSRIRPSYTTENITAFTVFFEPNVIPIGSAKTSIVRFWVGVGALKKRKDDFIEMILSPTQLKKADAEWEPVKIEGLNEKNFKRIRVI